VKREMNVEPVTVDPKVSLAEMVLMAFQASLARWDNQELLVRKVKKVSLDSADLTVHRENLVAMVLLDDPEERENPERSRSTVSREKKVNLDLLDQLVFQESTDNKEEMAFPVKTASKERPVPSDALVPTAFPDCRENPAVEVNLDVPEKTSQESLANKENVVNLVMLEYPDTQDDQVKRENRPRNTLLLEKKENKVYLD